MYIFGCSSEMDCVRVHEGGAKMNADDTPMVRKVQQRIHPLLGTRIGRC